jgi:hypothetical protein
MATKAYHKPDNVEILECQPPPGAKLHMMMFYAKRAAKEEMKARGIRVSSILPRDVRLLAEELLRDRWEEFERRAQPLLAKITSAAQRKQRSNRKTIPVQKSGAE